ncbi:MAG: 50S ribosomal protein L9, partial [Coriobacteriales bacterium]|nr:50S ribosomal protein L9 [Coriobacteriales bacterium]
MKVILLGEVKGKGGEGDVVDVAAGFANNYLLPRRLAEKATPGNLKQLEMRKHNIEKRELARTTDANTLLEVLNGKQVIVPA